MSAQLFLWSWEFGGLPVVSHSGRVSQTSAQCPLILGKPCCLIQTSFLFCKLIPLSKDRTAFLNRKPMSASMWEF